MDNKNITFTLFNFLAKLSMGGGLPNYQPTRLNDISNFFRPVTKNYTFFPHFYFLFKFAQSRTTLVYIIGCFLDGQIVLLQHLLAPNSYIILLTNSNFRVRLHEKVLEKWFDISLKPSIFVHVNAYASCTLLLHFTIRINVLQMKNDFKKMGDEMDHLSTNMAAITEFSGRISTTLQDRRQQITKLSGVHTLLEKVIHNL